jgi:hypothetical protein
MSIFRKLLSLLNGKKKREDEWAKNYSNQPVAKPKHPLPLDPGNSSMT